MAGRRAGPGGRLPGGYRAWLGGTGLALIGTQVLAFASAWVAAGRGGLLAGLVLTATNLPRVLLVLVGGSVADRVGPGRVLVGTGVAMVVVTGALAVGASRVGDPAVLLLAAGFAIGVVDAFHLPASGTVPRLLVPPAALVPAMSARQVVGQVAVFAGPPVGGVVVVAAGLTGAALVGAAASAVLLLVVVAVRLPATPPAPTTDGRHPRWAALDGVRLVARDAVLRPALLLTATVAAFLLPVSGLLLPLLARERSWSARSAGLVVGAVAAGLAVVAVLLTLRGTRWRFGPAAGVGLLLAAGGVAGLAAAPPAVGAPPCSPSPPWPRCATRPCAGPTWGCATLAECCPPPT
ncbi:hypothetical protein AWW66_12955 [Micromonospora rosaria]|uniref:Major facilitator superfamily (MFS) profile domain-containing protein n=1 Tax=Micromonospora rosaria TaxID=47874 RepID=A0A136PSV1_9ACTN|nr:MFS transporter [Micromonospora rosaria]KXK61569.1 hypothetical protein AWW66_12955 [Micromonospora rosaria]